MKRLEIAQYIALASSIASILGIMLGGFSGSNFGTGIMLIGVVGGIVSYIFGGFGTAIKMSATIAKWGWFIVPFPYDIFTFVAAFTFAIYAFIFIPIIPVRKAYKQYFNV